MKRFNLKKALKTMSAAGLLFAAVCTQTSCSDLWKEQHPGTYYINSGETIATFLEEGKYKDEFTDFVYVLKRAGIWGELRTYGEHTCFAPTNEAFEAYLDKMYADAPESKKHFYTCLDSLTDMMCDTIAKTHLCGATFYCSDMSGDGAFPYPNLLDRYLTYYSFPDTVSMTITENGDTVYKTKLGFKINQEAKIIEADDTVQNGVVHIVGSVIQPSNKWLPGLMKDNPQLSIFTAALEATAMKSELEKYIDADYPWSPTKGLDPSIYYDSTMSHYKATGTTAKALIYDTGAEKGQTGVIPDLRYFKYTMFVVKDSVLEKKYGIDNLDKLRDFAKSKYPEGAGLADNEDGSSLKKFIQYHILPMQLEYNQLNLVGSDACSIVKKNRTFKDELDVEDFYEPMLPHSIMRVSTPYKDDDAIGIFINRKGTEKLGLEYPGIKIDNSNDGMKKSALNGCYHYIEDVLLYDYDTRNYVLNTRMRVMANSMSPDFINSGASNRLNNGGGKDKYTVGFLKGYCQNFEALNESTQFWVRYADQSFGCWMGYEMTIRGIYDICMKLPNVPFDGTYEIRLWVNSMSNYQATYGGANPRGIVQFYFSDGQLDEFGDKVWRACGIPVDLRIAGGDARIGNIKDSEIESTYGDDAKEYIDLFDKAMRNRGYMKGMDSYNPSGSQDQNLRSDVDCNRKIVCNEFMRADGTYYLRMRQVMDTESADFPFNFVEVVPKSVYENDTNPEDKH